jgi:TonB family protein
MTAIQLSESGAKMATQKSDKIGTPVIEVKILWGTSILQVSHINQSKNFLLTSTKTKKDEYHFVVGSEVLGDLNELPVVCNNKLLILETTELEINNISCTVKDLIVSGELIPSNVIDGAYELDIEPLTNYRLKFGNITIIAKKVAPAVKLENIRKYDPTLIGATICSAIAVFASVLTINAIANADSSLLTQGNEEDRLNDLRAFIQHQQERQIEQPQNTEHNQQSSQSSSSHPGPTGKMGNRQTINRNARRAIQNNNEPPHLSRLAARDAVASRGIFAALGSSSAAFSGGSSGVVSPFGAMTESGLENQSANGNLTGDSIGDAFGYNGLGQTGTGWGANGPINGLVGVGRITTRGHGDDQNYGNDRGSNLHNRGNHGPIVRTATPSIVGLLSPESIRRVVVRNLSQIIHCHEQGLVQNPSLEGRVVVRFVIGNEGTILGSNISESNIAIPSVAECISNAVRRWQFPAPEGGGVVTVNYPFNLQHPE